jgi:hypothetical protein
MKTKGILISSVIGLAAVGAIAATSLSLGSAAHATGSGGHGMSKMFGGGHHGMGQGGMGGGRGMAHLCGPARSEKVEHAISFVDDFMTFSGPQKQAWDNLAGALRAGDEKVGAACATFKDGKPPQSATGKLGMAESFLTAGLAVVQQVRPAFDRFYDTLNEKQQKSLDDLLSRRHHR